jgi:hypothetical protein
MGLFHSEVNNLYKVYGKYMIVKRISQMLMKNLSFKSELFYINYMIFNVLY